MQQWANKHQQTIFQQYNLQVKSHTKGSSGAHLIEHDVELGTSERWGYTDYANCCCGEIQIPSNTFPLGHTVPALT